MVQAAPPERKRGGILFTVEGGRWLVTLICGGRDYPPTDEAAFLEFARSLPVPDIYDAIRKAEPLSPIRGYRGTENRLRHFERMLRQPENFIALGDAVCAFNPVYGQGMRLTKVTAAPWMLATSPDYRYRETEGGSPSVATRFMHRYMDQVLKLSTFDQTVRKVLLEAFSMLVQPSALFRPNIAFRVLRNSWASSGIPKARLPEHPAARWFMAATND